MRRPACVFLILTLICTVFFSCTSTETRKAVRADSNKRALTNTTNQQLQNKALHVESLVKDSVDTLLQFQETKVFLKKFRSAIIGNDPALISTLIFFPLQTQPQWMDEDLKNVQIYEKDGLIDKNEFLKYYGKELFDKDDRRILRYPLQDEDVHPIDLKTDDFSDYYKKLINATHSGPLLFTYYLQWQRPDGRGDYWFGLVIGKVKGECKVLAYYSSWPIK